MGFLLVGGPRDGQRVDVIRGFLEVPVYEGPVVIGKTLAENLTFKIHVYYRETLSVCGSRIDFYRSQDLSIVEAITQVFENYHAKKNPTSSD